MTYAAWFELHDDPEIIRHPLAVRVYARLLRRPGIFFVAQPVKVDALALEIGASRRHTANMLDMLTRLGYLAEHGRQGQGPGVRQMTVLQVRCAER